MKSLGDDFISAVDYFFDQEESKFCLSLMEEVCEPQGGQCWKINNI